MQCYDAAMNEPAKDREREQIEAMGRVRELRARDRIGADEVRRRPWWPRILGLLLALVVVGTLALGLDAFLTAFQRLLNTPAEPAPAQSGQPEESKTMPVFVVPEEPALRETTPPEDPAQRDTTPSDEPAPQDDSAPR
jgi:hypothetical protein